MKAEILATGDEIRSGALVDSNSAFIAEQLEENGIEVVRHTSVGDDLPILVATLREIGERAELAVVTGGLGPTTDDLSAEAAAKAAGVELVFSKVALENVESFFKKFDRPMTESNRKQALLPDHCHMLYNPVGTAPGFAMTIGRCRFFFLPGVPYEMKRMLAEHVIPEMRCLQGDSAMHSRVKTITTFGLPESLAGEKVAGVEAAFPGIKLGLRANFPQIQVKLYGRDKHAALLDQRLADAGCWALERLGTHVISENGERMEAVVGRLLLERSATVALAESCTGGLMANWLTNVAGSSAYFLFPASPIPTRPRWMYWVCGRKPWKNMVRFTKRRRSRWPLVPDGWPAPPSGFPPAALPGLTAAPRTSRSAPCVSVLPGRIELSGVGSTSLSAND